jgi:hypothetical protein
MLLLQSLCQTPSLKVDVNNADANRNYYFHNGPLSRSPRVSLLLDRSVALSSITGLGAGAAAAGAAGAGGICATQNLGYCRCKLLTKQAVTRTIIDDSRRTGK